MNYISTDSENVVLGSGELYAALYTPEKSVVEMTTEEMDCIGYIKDSATITTNYERKSVTTANRGTIANFTTSTEVEFSTGIMSFNLENVAKYLTGSTYEDGSFYFEDSQAPTICLKFVMEDTANNKKIVIDMYRCNWTGNLNLDFNTEDAVEFDYTFAVLANMMDNKVRYFKITESAITPASTEQA